MTPGANIPWTVTTVTAGFTDVEGALYDGANVWVTDTGAGTLLKLNTAGAILQTVTVGSLPAFPIFDGTNIWVPNFGSNSVLGSFGTGAITGPTGACSDGVNFWVTLQGASKLARF